MHCPNFVNGHKPRDPNFRCRCLETKESTHKHPITNAENGFCVLRTKARGHRDVVTVVGYAAAVSAGEWITASGEWVNDRTHGQQFKARFLRTSPPTSADGVEKYLNAIERIVVAALEAAE
jgi:hypothetical protein